MRIKMFAVVLPLLFAAVSLNAQNTYYISSSSGSDNNTAAQAESKSSPWAHLPGMASCTGSCASYSPTAGDRFILEGCDTWTNGSFPVRWNWGGSSGSEIYIGVDPTWYNTSACSSGWNRPIFTAGGQAIAGSDNAMVLMGGSAKYVTLDNIEMTGMYWSGSAGYGTLEAISLNGTDYDTVEHMFIHGWTHGSGAGDGFNAILGDTNPPHCDHCVMEYNVIEDADGSADSGAATYALGGTMAYNVIYSMSNGLLTSGNGSVHDNYIHDINQSFDSSDHENGIEEIGQDGTMNIYNNVLVNMTAVSAFLGGFPYTTNFWNNVVLPGANGNSIQLEGRNSSWGGLFANNTVYDSKSQSCFIAVGSNIGITLANNHCISGNGLSTNSYSSQTNLVQSPSQATANSAPHYDQYSSAASNLFSPTAASNSTVGAGTNLTSSWPSGFPTTDTTYACKVSTTFQVVCPARTPNARPATGAWDVGAYEFGNTVMPAAPINLTGVVK